MQVLRLQLAVWPEAQRILVSHPDRIFAQADARRSTAAVRPEQNSNAAESSARGCGSKAFQKWRDGWQIFVKRACTNNEDVHRLNVNTRIPVFPCEQLCCVHWALVSEPGKMDFQISRCSNLQNTETQNDQMWL